MFEKSHKIQFGTKLENPPDISFIIPVYNTAQYLKNCIDSIIGQNLSSYEIVIINDGSTDGSMDVINTYTSSYTYIRAISQKNRGLSVSRNIGMKYATGKYILFVDSDDRLEPNTITKLVNLSMSSSADIIVGRVKSVFNDGHSVIWGIDMSPGIWHASEYLSFITQHGGYVPMVFNYLFKREFLVSNALTFYPAIIHEDELWTPRALVKATTIAIENTIHYAYIQRRESIMNTLQSEKRANSLIIIIRELLQEYVKINCTKQGMGSKFLELHIMNLFNVCSNCCGQTRGFQIGQIIGEIIYEFQRFNQQVNFMPIIKKYIQYINSIQH